MKTKLDVKVAELLKDSDPDPLVAQVVAVVGRFGSLKVPPNRVLAKLLPEIEPDKLKEVAVKVGAALSKLQYLEGGRVTGARVFRGTNKSMMVGTQGTTLAALVQECMAIAEERCVKQVKDTGQTELHKRPKYDANTKKYEFEPDYGFSLAVLKRVNRAPSKPDTKRVAKAWKEWVEQCRDNSRKVTHIKKHAA